MFDTTKIVLMHFCWTCVVKYANIVFIYALNCFFILKIIKSLILWGQIQTSSPQLVKSAFFHAFFPKGYWQLNTDTSVFLVWYLFSILQIEYRLNTDTSVLENHTGYWILVFSFCTGQVSEKNIRSTWWTRIVGADWLGECGIVKL